MSINNKLLEVHYVKNDTPMSAFYTLPFTADILYICP